MATTTAKAFEEFAGKLLLTTPQKDTIKSRRSSTHNYLAEYFGADSDMPLTKAKLIGSAARETIIRPVDDIDVLAIFSNANDAYSKYRWDSRKFLYRVRDALSKYTVKVVGARGQAVRLFYNQAPHVDIAPVFSVSTGGYYLPAGAGTWISTDPDKVDEWLTQKNQDLSYNLKTITRMLKCWNRSHSRRLKSFHLELMVANTFSSLGSNFRDACTKFFQWAPSHISVQDPAGYSGDLSTYLTWTTRQELVDSLNAAHTRACSAMTAESAGNHKEAIRLWGIIFGDEFPSYG